jgi:hypothetical protein
MASALIVQILLVAGLICLILGGIVVWRGSTPPGPNRKTRAYISELEDTIENVRSLAYDHKDVEPGLADIIIDELKQHRTRIKTKELE